MAAAKRPERAKAKTSGASSRSRVKVYFDPSRVKPRQPVLPVIEGGSKTLTLQEQLGMAPSPPRKSERKRTSREDFMAEVAAKAAALKKRREDEKETSTAE